MTARSQGFVITTAQLRTHDWQRHDTRRELRRGTWWAPARGVLSPVVPNGPDRFAVARQRHVLMSAAEVLLRPDHLIAGRSAAIVAGLPTRTVPARPQIISRAGDTTGRRSRAHVRAGPLAADRVIDWFGAPVLTPARTVVDVARSDRRDGLMAADAALAAGLTDPHQLQRELRAVRCWPGVRQARQVIAIASPLAESALESLVRLALHDDGFPTPELQVWIQTRGANYRVDMLLRAHRLIIEIDGLGKYTPEELRREKLREARLRALGYRVERVSWEDVVRYWPQTRTRLWAAMAA
jgi:very-short-patch-repair endonuclease